MDKIFDSVKNWLGVYREAIMVVFVVLLTLFYVYKTNVYENMYEELKAKSEKDYEQLIADHNKVINDISKTTAEAAEKERLIVVDYQQKLNTLDQQYQEKLIELEALRKVKAQEFAKIIKKDPEAAMNEIAKKFVYWSEVKDNVYGVNWF